MSTDETSEERRRKLADFRETLAAAVQEPEADVRVRLQGVHRKEPSP